MLLITQSPPNLTVKYPLRVHLGYHVSEQPHVISSLIAVLVKPHKVYDRHPGLGIRLQILMGSCLQFQQH